MTFDKNPITGIVLAGGESSRMGEDKSQMLISEQQLIEFSLNALKPFCQELIISSNKEVHKSYGFKTISDKQNKIGPISGIQSALANSKTDYIIILPCDSPMVKQAFVEFLISKIDNEIDALVPKYQNHLEPLFAIYHKRILPIVDQQIAKQDYRLTNLLKQIRTETFEVQDRSCFVNINTPEDYKNYLSLPSK